jgi:hypothetical protein
MMPSSEPKPTSWKDAKRTLALCLLVATGAGGALAFRLWGPTGAGVFLAGLLCLASGLWVTERLIAVFLGTRKANPTALVFLMTGKVLWWGALFFASRRLPVGYDGAVGLAIGAFLLALLIATVRHYGMPRISEGNPPSSP